MIAKIITVCNQKGGAGKSTITMSLAAGLARREKADDVKYKVAVVDADKQSTATRWSSAAPEDKPFPASVIGLSAADSRVHKEVQKFVNDYDFIIIDCPPAIESLAPQSALLVSDLAIVPIIPSPPDLWAAVGIESLIEKALVTNETLQSRLLINAKGLDSLAEDILDIISKEFKTPLMNTQIHSRNAFRQAAGRSVFDLQPSKHYKAQNEVDDLCDEVLNILFINNGGNIDENES